MSGKSRSESAVIAAEAGQQRGPPEPDDGAELGGSLGARPAAMFHRDTRAVADGFEANFDLGGFAGPEWVARPFKEQPNSGLPCQDAANGIVVFHEPAGVEAHRAAVPVARAALPPDVDLVGEEAEGGGRIGPHDRSDTNAVGCDHMRLPFLVFSTCSRKAPS